MVCYGLNLSLLILFQFEFINWAGSHKLFLDYHVRNLSGKVRVRQFHMPRSIEHVIATEIRVELELGEEQNYVRMHKSNDEW